MKQNKRGFTLIELLAVIVILAIIALIAVPVIMNIISSARKSAFEDTAYGLVSAGEMYYASALLNDGITGTKVFTFTEGGSIPEGLNVKGEMPKSGVLEVNKDGKTALAITNGTICIIKGYNDTKLQILESFETCELPAKTLSELARKNDFATSIDACATTGTTCTPGTEFAIEVAPGEIKDFYVVSDVDNKVTLIMDRNIGETVAWINNEHFLEAGGDQNDWDTFQNRNVYGPITAINYLESQTAGWTNIEAKDYTLTDDQGQYSDFQRIGVRARMITKTEVDTLNEIGTNSWLYDNLNSFDELVVPYGYWTSSGNAEYSGLTWFIYGGGFISFDYAVDYNSGFGVRPVIEISK